MCDVLPSLNQTHQKLHYILDRPWQRVHVDYAGLFQIFFVAVDVHSKWVEAILTFNATVTTTVDVLMTMFARYCIPELLVSDNAPTFTSDDFKCLSICNDIKKQPIPSYNQWISRTNGAISKISCEISKAPQLPNRNLPHITSGESPVTFIFGQKL